MCLFVMSLEKLVASRVLNEDVYEMETDLPLHVTEMDVRSLIEENPEEYLRDYACMEDVYVYESLDEVDYQAKIYFYSGTFIVYNVADDEVSWFDVREKAYEYFGDLISTWAFEAQAQ